jgi:hypothetical protein
MIGFFVIQKQFMHEAWSIFGPVYGYKYNHQKVYDTCLKNSTTIKNGKNEHRDMKILICLVMATHLIEIFFHFKHFFGMSINNAVIEWFMKDD